MSDKVPCPHCNGTGKVGAEQIGPPLPKPVPLPTPLIMAGLRKPKTG